MFESHRGRWQKPQPYWYLGLSPIASSGSPVANASSSGPTRAAPANRAPQSDEASGYTNGYQPSSVRLNIPLITGTDCGPTLLPMAPFDPLDLSLPKTAARWGVSFATWGALSIAVLLALPLGAQASDDDSDGDLDIDFNVVWDPQTIVDWYFTDANGEETWGTIAGLVEGSNPGGAGEIVEVTQSPLTSTLGGGWIFSPSSSPFAFNIESGELIAVDALYKRRANGVEQSIKFGAGSYRSGVPIPVQLFDGVTYASGPEIFFIYPVPTGTPSTAPAPLPIFGAAAAFGASRQLRKRIRATKSPAVTATPD